MFVKVVFRNNFIVVILHAEQMGDAMMEGSTQTKMLAVLQHQLKQHDSFSSIFLFFILNGDNDHNSSSVMISLAFPEILSTSYTMPK